LLVQNIFSAKLVNFSKGDFFSFFFQSYPLCQVCLTALICMHYCLSIFTPLLSFSLSVFLFYLSTIMQSTSMARFCVFARRGLTIFLFSSSYSTQYSPPLTHTPGFVVVVVLVQGLFTVMHWVRSGLSDISFKRVDGREGYLIAFGSTFTFWVREGKERKRERKTAGLHVTRPWCWIHNTLYN
jgi:hypothetical protein